MQNTLEKEELSAEETVEATESASTKEVEVSEASAVKEVAACEAVADDATSVTETEGSGEAAYKSYAKHGFRYGCYLFIKRTFDIVSSGLFLLIFSWLYLILAIVVKCSDGGTVFYRHKRVGKNGKTIYIPKFRSMKKNADKLEDMLTPEQLEQYKREYKIDNDPRITKVGKFIRKYSIDELPQFFNVLKGDMSLVGTRPPTLDEFTKYSSHHKRRLSMRPGITGMWQVSGRSDIHDFEEVVKLDCEYIDNWSILTDIKILFKTVSVVFTGKGAK